MWSITVPPLADYLAEIPDVRKARGTRHRLPAVLLLACVAMLCGARSQAAIAAWAANYGEPWRHRLGLTHRRGPSQATLSRLFGLIDPVELERHLGRWAEQVLAQAPLPGAQAAPLEVIALDGKTLRGSKKRGAPGSHLLSALSQRLGIILGQVAVGDKANEIAATTDLLAELVLTGRLVTVDALLTQASLAQAILDRGGDYLMVVKQNQPTVYEDLVTLFADPTTAGLTTEEVRVHGGRLEHRHLTASTELVGYTDWPGLQQALCLDRTVLHKATGAIRQERAYAITSVPAERAAPATLLLAWREHWHIENKAHHVRDVTFDEDHSSVRAPHIPQVMAALRNTAIGLARLAHEPNIAAACRRFAAQPDRALTLVGLPT
jgi:predicted transposase YbfD/YdcC